eukprot:NODE_299_length_10456_cov_1.003669.p5 type:complete len:221 gc:universal NODE_299_length_10456_cov_1.003669:7178-6516(-)
MTLYQTCCVYGSSSLIRESIFVFFAGLLCLKICHKRRDGTKHQKMTESKSKTLFVGQLPFSSTKAEIEELFDCEIENIKLPKNFRTGRSKGIAFVTFAKRADLEHILAQEDMELGGRTLVFREASDEAPALPVPKEQSSSLFVGNLPYSCSEEDLAEFFEGCLDAVVCTKRESGESLGYGYVHYNTVEEAVAAFQDKRGASMNDRHLRLDFDVQKKKQHA